ncbi:hypothetical protein V7S43_012539 [Phytophthora oleae]|uniref:Ankyrin repeat protein n=1 Tax=Phytophthora oleae TaxID=2107226 RepID=A0ABD3F5T5_9STRA
MDYAAGWGHLDVWLGANGYEGNLRDALEVVAENGNLRIIKWLLSSVDNDTEYESYTRFALGVAQTKLQQQVIQWLEPQVEPDSN